MRNAAIFLLLVLSGIAFGQAEDPQLRREVQQLYAAFDRAVAKMDEKAILDFLDPSFVAVDERGKQMTYKDFKAMMKSMSGMAKDMKSRITVQQVQGDMREAYAWITMESTMSVKEGKTWKRMKMTERFVETLKKTPGGWKISYSQVLPKE